jgi:alkanesulfonate monooxygenase SsuD/methylene tetrahydromethanopterin reductase-like flavin-dependent oxidoreductase (luciferase family)
MLQALHLYRTNFKPSERLEKPYAMVCINIIAADSNRDADSCLPPCSRRL